MNRYNDLDKASLYSLFLTACSYGDYNAVFEIYNSGRIHANMWGVQPIRAACEHGHEDIVDFLYEDSNVETALNILKKMYPSNPKNWEYLEQKIANEQRLKIISEIQYDDNLNEVKRKL